MVMKKLRVIGTRKVVFVKPYSSCYETAKRLFDLYKSYKPCVAKRSKDSEMIDKIACTPAITIIGFELSKN